MRDSWLRSGFGLAAIIVTALIAYQSYLYVNDGTISDECKSSLLSKKNYRKGVTYFDIEDGSAGRKGLSGFTGFKFTKNWTADFEDDKPYQKLH